MGLWGAIMVAANAAQLVVWGKQALDSEKGKAVTADIKKKAGEAGANAQAVIVVAGTVATEAGRVIDKKTRPLRDAAIEQIDKLTKRVEQMDQPTDEEVEAEVRAAAEQVAEILKTPPQGGKLTVTPKAPEVSESSDSDVEIAERRDPPDLPKPADSWD